MRRLTLFAAGALTVLGLPALFGNIAPAWTDLPGEFALQYLFGAAAVGLFAGFLFRASYLAIGLSALAVVINLIPVTPYLAWSPAPPDAAAMRPLKLLQANVMYLNKDAERLRKLIADESPDIVSIQEANSVFAKMFKALSKDYPYQAVFPEDRYAAGRAVLSRLPLSRIGQVTFPNAVMPAQIFEVKDGGQAISFFSLHTANPLSGVAARDASFAGIAKYLQAGHPSRVVIIGDFNATPWCPGMRRFMQAAPGLYNAREGRGLFPSWPASFPSPFRIPIDEMLVSRNIAVQAYRLGPDIGSDHLPVLTTIALRSGT